MFTNLANELGHHLVKMLVNTPVISPEFSNNSQEFAHDWMKFPCFVEVNRPRKKQIKDLLAAASHEEKPQFFPHLEMEDSQQKCVAPPVMSVGNPLSIP